MHQLVWSRLLFVVMLTMTLGKPVHATSCVVDVPCTIRVLPYTDADIFGWIDLDNRIVLQASNDLIIEAEGVDLLSKSSLLVPVPQETGAAPFTFFLRNEPDQITVGNLRTTSKVGPDVPLAEYDLGTALSKGVEPCDDLTEGVGRYRQTVESFCTLAGDVNFDGSVQFADFLVLSTNFGRVDAVWPDGDFDWDRKVEFSDFLNLSDNFGRSILADGAIVTLSVPEPNSRVLLFAMVSLLLLRRFDITVRP